MVGRRVGGGGGGLPHEGARRRRAAAAAAAPPPCSRAAAAQHATPPRAPRPMVHGAHTRGVAPRARGGQETCPVSTDGGARRVQSVREGGGGGASGATNSTPAPQHDGWAPLMGRERGGRRCGEGSPRPPTR